MNRAGLARYLFCMVLMACFAGSAQAQGYPNRPIKFILPFAAGGGGDTFARPLAQMLAETLGQQVIIENITGGAAIVGTEVAARAPADGYAFLMMSNAHAINETLHPKLGYNLFKDFAPVTQLCTFSLVLVVNPSLPANSLSELIALAKSRPGKLAYASSGLGSIYHLPMELLKSMAGVDMLHVPYKSSATARTDILSGQVQLMFDGLATMQPFIKANRVRALGISSARRSEAAPELPTIAEAALPGFEGDGWLGFAAPAGTPPAIINRMQAEIATILTRPQVRASYVAQAAEPIGSTPAQYGAFLKQEVEKWGKVIRVSGAKAE